VKLRERFCVLAHGMGVRLSYLPFIVKAVVAALKKYPDINAWSDEATRTLVRKKEYNIGIATATERGLLVTVVRDADKKSIFEIAREIETLAEKARAGKATLHELTGSTFTITSLGKSGGLGATPVINHPEVAILGIHKIEPRAMVDGNRQVVVRDCMNLSGSYDHRWIDGHIAAEFHQHVIALLSQPNLLLLGTV
jgi:pyruvate dehydrogenase E2 component (dihydrolipoamide acetyltransferase)